jgi:hypothetical protein
VVARLGFDALSRRRATFDNDRRTNACADIAASRLTNASLGRLSKEQSLTGER